MGNKDSTKQQIIKKLMLMPQRLVEMEAEKTERTWAHERLKDPDNKVKLLFDRVFDCRVMIDEKGGIVYANEAACMVLGYAKEQLLKLSAEDLYTNDEAEKMQAAAIRVLRDGVCYVGETEFIAKNGEMITVEAGAVSLKLADRSYIVYSFRDITERKQAEEALRKSEEKHRTLLETGATPIYWVDIPSGEITYVNKKAEELFGRAGTDLLGHTVFEFVPEGEVALHQEKMQEAAREMKIEEQPIPQVIIRPSGEPRYTEVYPTMFESEGKIVAQVVCPDITGRKWAVEQLRRSEEFSHTLLANAPNPILVINPDTSIRYVNPALEELTGFAFAELVGSVSPYPWWMEETLQETGRDLADAITRGAQGLEQLCKKRNGERFWIELTSTDELTGLLNRRQFYNVLESEMNRIQRYGGCFTLAMLDLDGFKEYNDRFGHTNGDAVLRSLAQTLKTVLRKPDMAFRYGGDEFAIILPSTEAQKAKNIMMAGLPERVSCCGPFSLEKGSHGLNRGW